MARIAFLLPNMAGGGAERVALTLINAFIERGHGIDLVLMNATGELMAQLPPQVRVFDLKAHRVRNLLWPLVRYLRDERPDAMQARMWPVTIVAILAKLLSRTRTRLVVSDHNCLSRVVRPGSLSFAMLCWSIRLFYPSADGRICVSTGIAEDLASLSGLDRSSWRVIHNPVPPRIAPVSVTTVPPNFWMDGVARVISVGTLKAQKNHLLLLHAFSKLLRRRRAQLVILGEGSLRSALEELAVNLGISEHVSLPGFMGDTTPYYESADLFVLSSDYEGFGNVLAEALQGGLRVVSTDCPWGPSEILEDGRYGRLVPCDDPTSLAEAMDAALAEPLDAAVQRRRAEEISGAHIVDDYLSILLPKEEAGHASIY